MPSTTTYYGLALYNSTTDGAETFLDYRTAIAGTGGSSNMNLLDAALKNIQDQIDVLDARKGIVAVVGNYVSANYYEASTTEITAYDTGQVIALSLDTDSNGTVTLNINSLGTLSLMKVDATGAYVNINGADLRAGRIYNFEYDGTRWVWVNATSSDQINLEGTATNVAVISSTNGIEDGGHALSEYAEISVYDPQAIGADAFDTDNHTDGVTNGVYTLAERSKLAGIEAGADVTDAANIESAISGSSADTLTDTSELPFVKATTLVKITWANFKSTLESLYSIITKTAPTGTVVGTTDTQTLTNKRVQPRVVVTTYSSTPSINTDNGSIFRISSISGAITSMTTNLTGTPTHGEMFMVQFLDNGTPRSITWGASFRDGGTALPTATTASKLLKIILMWDSADSIWECVGSQEEA